MRSKHGTKTLMIILHLIVPVLLALLFRGTAVRRIVHHRVLIGKAFAVDLKSDWLVAIGREISARVVLIDAGQGRLDFSVEIRGTPAVVRAVRRSEIVRAVHVVRPGGILMPAVVLRGGLGVGIIGLSGLWGSGRQGGLVVGR